MINKLNSKSKTKKSGVLLTDTAPFVYAEAYRTLRTNVKFVSSATGAKSIVVTSALPSESKSTTAINLALTLAKNNLSVILVECDLRKPVLRERLKLERATNGLTAFLSGACKEEECIIRLEAFKIDVIHAGTVPPNPAELLNLDRMRYLIESLKKRYDYVILDTPPITVVTDAAVVGTMADGAILVVRSKFASNRTIQLAKQRLKAVNIKILGAVLTQYDTKKSRKHTEYGYGYGEEYNQESTSKSKKK